MDMKNYHFKDTRPIFKWMYIIYGLTAISTVLLSFISDISLESNSFLFILYIAIVFAIYKVTNQDVYVDDNYIKANKMSTYNMITKITVTTDILIWNGDVSIKIKVIDFENNYNQYKELMEHVYSKIDKNTELQCQTVNELLKQVYDNKKIKMNIYINPTTNKPVLGGFLLFLMIIACIGAFNLLTTLFIAIGIGFDLSLIYMIGFGIAQVFTAIMLYQRKNKVKYALAAVPVLTVVNGIITVLTNLYGDFSIFALFLGLIYICVISFASYLMAKVYFYYIDNFTRPKLTLIN